MKRELLWHDSCGGYKLDHAIDAICIVFLVEERIEVTVDFSRILLGTY